MNIAKIKMSEIYYTDKYGIKHFAPYWGKTLAQHAYNKVYKKLNGLSFDDFYKVLNYKTAKYYIVLMAFYPKISDNKLFYTIVDDIIKEIIG